MDKSFRRRKRQSAAALQNAEACSAGPGWREASWSAAALCRFSVRPKPRTVSRCAHRPLDRSRHSTHSFLIAIKLHEFRCVCPGCDPAVAVVASTRVTQQGIGRIFQRESADSEAGGFQEKAREFFRRLTW